MKWILLIIIARIRGNIGADSCSTNTLTDLTGKDGCPSLCTYPSAQRQIDRSPLTSSTSWYPLELSWFRRLCSRKEITEEIFSTVYMHGLKGKPEIDWHSLQSLKCQTFLELWDWFMLLVAHSVFENVSRCHSTIATYLFKTCGRNSAASNCSVVISYLIFPSTLYCSTSAVSLTSQ